MREIKFRAWHPEFGEMVYASNQSGWYFEKREFTPFLFEVGFSHYPKETWEIMQWTGLVDKNGVEIYEGDILQVPNGDTGIIEYNRCAFVCKTIIRAGSWDFRHYEHFSGVVKGNIYQNSHLIKNEKA